MISSSGYLHKPIREAFFLGSAQGTAVAASLVIHIAASRLLLPAEYALFGLLLMAGNGMQTVLAGGIPNALRRAVSTGSEASVVLLRPALMMHLAVCGAVWLLLVLLACGVGVFSAAMTSALLIAVAATELLMRAGILAPSMYILNGRARYGTQTAIQFGYQAGRVVLLTFLLAGGAGPIAGMAGLAIAALVAGCVGSQLAQLLRPEPRSDLRAAWTQMSHWLRFGGWHDVLLFLIPVSNLLVIKTMANSSAAASVYIACFAVARTTSALGVVFAGIFFAPIALAASQGDEKSIQSSLAKAVRFQAFLLIPIVVFLPLRGPDLLQLIMGVVHRPPGVLLCLLLTSGTLLTLWTFVGEMLAAAGYIRGRLILAAAATIAGVPLMFACTWIGQSQGAALSLMTTTLAGVMASIGFASRVFGPFVPWGDLVRAIVAATVAAWCISSTAFPPGVLWTGMDGVIRCGVYVLVLAYLCRLRAV